MSDSVRSDTVDACPVAPKLAPRSMLRLIFGVEALILLHLTIILLANGLQMERLLVDSALLAIALFLPSGRRFVSSLFPVWCIAVVYVDLLPIVLRLRGPIHVGDLYDAELAWFGVTTSAGRVIPCALFKSHHWAFVDLICGFVYVGYQVILLAFAVYYYFRSPECFSRLVKCYFFVHLCGFATYVLYPAAPPWYVDRYGFAQPTDDVVSDPAGLIRLDALLGVPIAAGMARLSSNVFGAMPSLHMALATLFPLVGFHHGWKSGTLGLVVAGITAFGTVYFGHHYILDLLAGVTYAVATYSVVAWFDRRVASPRPAHLSCIEGAA